MASFRYVSAHSWFKAVVFNLICARNVQNCDSKSNKKRIV